MYMFTEIRRANLYFLFRATALSDESLAVFGASVKVDVI